MEALAVGKPESKRVTLSVETIWQAQALLG